MSVSRTTLVAMIVAVLFGMSPTLAVSAESVDKLLEKSLLISFAGKGSSLAFDAGITKCAFEELPALRENRVIVAGNSSGSILAAYYSCFGFSPVSVEYAQYRLINADVSAVRGMESGTHKAAKLLQNLPTELSPEVLREYIAFAVGVERWQDRTIAEIVAESKARPKYPVMIVAANQEVLDNRGTAHFLSSKNHKVFDPRNFSVSWKPEVDAFYRQHPDLFADHNAELRPGPTAYIGKACTCFCDRSMFDLLSRVPASERLFDLRLIENAADIALAIQASVAEPSYFPAIAETDYSKLLVDDKLNNGGLSKHRYYYGGFIMPTIAQDARRMLPSLRVLSTSWTPVPLAARQMIKAWDLVDIRQCAQLGLWWADLEIYVPKLLQSAMVNRTLVAEKEFAAGYQQAATSFALENALPEYVEVPAYDYPAARALAAPKPGDVEPRPAGDSRPPRLKTMRGLKPLLAKPAAAKPTSAAAK